MGFPNNYEVLNHHLLQFYIYIYIFIIIISILIIEFIHLQHVPSLGFLRSLGSLLLSLLWRLRLSLDPLVFTMVILRWKPSLVGDWFLKKTP